MPVLNVTPPSPVMKGATSTSKGAAGLVPAPLSGDQAQFLRGDGSWGTPPGWAVTQQESSENAELPILLRPMEGTGTIGGSVVFDGDVTLNPSKGTVTAKELAVKNSAGTVVASADADGLVKGVSLQSTTMTELSSAASKYCAFDSSGKVAYRTATAVKEDLGINLCATKTELSAKQDKLTAGTNITIDGTTISAKDTTYGVATTSANGLMSASDKAKLDGINLDSINMDLINSAIQGKQDKITAGSGLSFSGTTLNHASSITAGTKGSATAIPVITYNASGHITAMSTVATRLAGTFFSNLYPTTVGSGSTSVAVTSGGTNIIYVGKDSSNKEYIMLIGTAASNKRGRQAIYFGYGSHSNIVKSGIVVNSSGTTGTVNAVTPATRVTFAEAPMVLAGDLRLSDDTDGLDYTGGVTYVTTTYFCVSNADDNGPTPYIVFGKKA